MTVLVSYDDTERLGRVRLSFSGYAANADYAVVERSIDQVNWQIIRGGDAIPLTAGSGSVDDYEFTANALNYYRVTAVDTAAPVFLGAGAVATGNNTSLNPALPGSLQDRDVMILVAAIRNSGIGTVNQPTGWTTLVNFGNVRVMYRRRVSGDTAPTVTFTGGVANADTLACVFAIRGFDPANPTLGTSSLNASAQDISTPAVAGPTGTITIRVGWKQDDATTYAISGYTSAFLASSTAGDDASLGALYVIRVSDGLNVPQTITVTGGAAAISRGIAITLPDEAYTDRETTSITPVVTRFRIKSPTRPSLNLVIEPLEDTLEVSRPARTGVFDVLNRTMPVAVTDLAGSRRFRLQLDVKGDQNKEDMDRRLATGAVYFLQPPSPIGGIPTAYFILDSSSYVMDTKYLSDSYTFSLSMIEVAQPAYTIYGNTTIWQDVVDDFATWTALISGEPTWSDVIDRISDSDVIVP